MYNLNSNTSSKVFRSSYFLFFRKPHFLVMTKNYNGYWMVFYQIIQIFSKVTYLDSKSQKISFIGSFAKYTYIVISIPLVDELRH